MKGIHIFLFKFSVLLVHDEFLLVMFKFISSFVETERSAYHKVAVEDSSEKHYYNCCKLICQFLDKYLVFNNKYLL